MALCERKFCGPTSKDNAVYEFEGVPQHELFHFPVVGAAPVGSGQERPADFDFALLFVVFVKSRRPDDLAIFAIYGDQRPSGLQGLAEKFLENLFFVAIGDRMLFPNERVCSYRVKIMKILWSKRSEYKEFAL